ncbi:ArsR/SmtB family transcription factor [Streptomyces xanthochromogenes]|uniref:ArsR/SmtB family transcription factor n=1 Tax=Streptomyces xanthochromogenes TaxID=67384 RepID=UPI0037F6A710
MRLATEPDPLWETVLGVQQLTTARTSRAYASWRSTALGVLTDRRLTGAVRLIKLIAPDGAPYFPDFLTPEAASSGLQAGLDALSSTPCTQVRGEMAMLFQRSRRVPDWCRGLAAGDRHAVREVRDAMELVHDAVIRPGWSAAAATTAADRAVRIRAMTADGITGLLGSLRPVLRWDPPVLSGPYPAQHDIHLRGSGLRLIPSHFCRRTPVVLLDSTLPPVLVYPVEHPADPSANGSRSRQEKALATLLGRSRARVLVTLHAAVTTTEIALAVGISPASASEHVRALREAGLSASARQGTHVVHTLTPLGTALVYASATS